MMKAKAARMLAIALAAAGFLLILHAAALFAMRKGLVPPMPSLDVRAWLAADGLPALLLARVDLAIVAAAAGAVLALGGIVPAWRRTAWIRAEERRREDGLRRVQQYRAEEGRCPYDTRLEPFIGTIADEQRERDRRVA